MTQKTNNNEITKDIILLDAVKDYITVNDDISDFDDGLLMMINTAYAILQDIAELNPVLINKDTKVSELIANKFNVQQMIISYLAMKAKLEFDPPTNEYLVRSMKENIDELEWRINTSGRKERV